MKLILAVVVAFCMAVEVNGAELDSFCGFKAGEMRKNGKAVGKDRKAGGIRKNGKAVDQDRIEVKPKMRFRKFDRVWLVYSKSGRLAEVQAVANVRGMKAAAAKREFEECIKWFRQAGIYKHPGFPSEEWSDDKGCNWCGVGAVKMKDAHLDANVTVRAFYRDPEMYNKGDRQMTGWLLDISVNWEDVDDRDLVPGAASKRVNPKVPLKSFVEQTFRTDFKSTCPVEAYDMITAFKSRMSKRANTMGRVGDEDADFACFLSGVLNMSLTGKSRHPYIDVISPMGRVTLPGVRFAYGRYLAQPICHCESVMFAYSNPKDKPAIKEPVNGAKDLGLCAIVLWGYAKDVKDGAKAASAFSNGVESWLGIKFADSNVTEKEHVSTTISTFREDDLVVTATTEVRVETLRYFVDKRGNELKGEKLRDFNLDFQNKVSAKMIRAPKSLSWEERKAMQSELEKKLFDSHGVTARFREERPMKYHVVISDMRIPIELGPLEK